MREKEGGKGGSVSSGRGSSLPERKGEEWIFGGNGKKKD